MTHNCPIRITLHSFQGGRFYKNRFVRTVSFKVWEGGPYWWTDLATADQHKRLAEIAAQLGIKSTPLLAGYEGKGYRRTPIYKTLYAAENGDPLTLAVTGLTARQLFNRVLRSHGFIILDRGKRSGLWFCRREMWPLYKAPRGNRPERYGKIPDEFRWLVESLIRPADIMSERPAVEYIGLDFGPDRKPPIWTCNLCGHQAEWDGWPKSSMAGLANSDYISSCPACNAAAKTTLGFTGQTVPSHLKDMFAGENGFCPVKSMQDDYLFMIS